VQWSLADKDVHAQAQLLARFVQVRALVVRVDAGGDIGIQILAGQSGRMAVYRPAGGRIELGQDLGTRKRTPG